ncbi:hypothetical protein P3T76_009078 [Phytophthora citrophthora]|uniref:Crinkler (CRN) family protein n=1 Tax=Phytophthora citrophthora TaxID=4793 RepID=A0AAD9GIX0_9STRA|nr:hypothetical protein P3T76_009078 [Phytophthora citrophthora]
MASVNLDWLVGACGKLDTDPEQVSHRLLHYRVTKDFNTDYFVFASQYVLEEIYRRLYNKNKQKLLEFIDASDGVDAAAVLRGHLFEGYVHSVLPRGGNFEIRLLVDDSEACTGEAHDDETCNGGEISTGGFWNEGRLRPRRKGKDKHGDNTMDMDDDVSMEDWESSSDDDSSDEDQQVSGDVSTSVIPNIASIGTDVTTITLPGRRTVVFNSADGLEAGDPSSYLRPAVKNYKSVDAIMKPNVMFQVTCAKEHPCKQAGLYDVLKLFKNPEAPALVFVLPPDRFLGFEYQKYLNSKDEAMGESKYVHVRKIRQFAMEVKTCVGADEGMC